MEIILVLIFYLHVLANERSLLYQRPQSETSGKVEKVGLVLIKIVNNDI